MSFLEYNSARFTPRAVCVLIPSQACFYAIESIKYPGKLVLPGGKIEDGETPESAVVRECIEETGQRPYNIRRAVTAAAGAYITVGFVAEFATICSDDEAPKRTFEGEVHVYSAAEILQRSPWPYYYALLFAEYHKTPVHDGWMRAGNDCVCTLCGLEYWRHHAEPPGPLGDEPWLTRLCNGMLVKL